jgi:hypothetical protein
MLSGFHLSTVCSMAAWLLAGILVSGKAGAQLQLTEPVMELELGPGWQARNDVRIPNDNQGTRFALDDISGSGPWLNTRLNLLWDFRDRHGIRFLYAPFSYEETGFVDTQIDFAGSSFAAGQPLQSRYQFNSWRLSYRYKLVEKDRFGLWLGATLKIRDAEIALQQGNRFAKDDDLGFVPLAYVAARYKLGERWYANAEMDALAGGPGRALDLGLRLDYRINPRWTIGAGYRTLEGGADTDEVYNFAWFNSAVFSTRISF